MHLTPVSGEGAVPFVSSPPKPVCDKNMTDSELAGDEREDGELEDGEIDDEGIDVEEEEETKESKQEVEEKEREKEERSHRHARKHYKKSREKRKSKKRKREKQKHYSPSSSDTSDDDTDHEHLERPRNRKISGLYRGDYNSLHGQSSHGKLAPRQSQHKMGEYERYSDYSEERYDYDTEEYRPSKDGPMGGPGSRTREHRIGPKAVHRQQPYLSNRGRGRGALPQSRVLLGKVKKQKGKVWGRGWNRDGDEGTDMMEEGKSFQKKRPVMTQEFINQHTVEHNGKYICKYFLEGRCIKGDQCKFEHELVVPDKKKELCKFYLQGYCSKGEKCIYMHNEYPCKFYHTGAKCYQGDNCKFSHEPLTDLTRKLLDKALHIEEDPADEDEKDLEELKMKGIAPLPKPPPGIGLLPTPAPTQEPGASKKIPSLFEIVVQPTVDLAQKIALRPDFYNNSSPEDTPEGSPSSHTDPSDPTTHTESKTTYQNTANVYEDYYCSQAQGEENLQSDQQSHERESNGSIPTVQKTLRLNHQHVSSGPEGSIKVKDDATNWYSSDDEDSSMNTILKSLKMHSEIMKNQQQQNPSPSTGPCDPRLHKDPRVRPEIRQCGPDPRLVRDPRKAKPSETPPSETPPTLTQQKLASAREEDEDGERELRETAAIIPLDPRAGMVLQDPRWQVKQFSHIRVDLLLSRPAFADTVVWAPEDLIPLLIPRQDPSINLPLPPLIADAQLGRSLAPPMPEQGCSSPPMDPRLATARLKEGVTRTRVPESKVSEKLQDPRTHKTTDPRMSRSSSLDSRPAPVKDLVGSTVLLDPRLSRGVRAEPEKLPPYAPRLSSNLSSPTSLLGGISLYDPRTPAQDESKEPPKRTGILKPTSTTPTSAPSAQEDPDPPQAPPPVTGSPPAPAVHNLPIPPLAGLIRPPYGDPRQSRPPPGAEVAEEPDDRPLKDVFKTFDPTASPFCQ